MKPVLAALALSALTGGLLAAEPVDYLRDIKPILMKSCSECHGPQKQRSGLRLDTAALAFKGGGAGPAIIPGKSSDSPIMKALTGRDDFKVMPPREPRLSAAQVELFKRWIDEGAKAPANEKAEGRVASSHWAFKPIVRPPEPSVKNEAWVRNPIDRFILAQLEKQKIQPAPEADRITLTRRLSLDLLGLPPTIEEVEAVLNDRSTDWYDKLVERLLASPHFGERWGRHWLDQARYADSNGFTIDGPRQIWKYRDWVIDALNRDLPFDQFTIQQIAGDLLGPPLGPPQGGGGSSPKSPRATVAPASAWSEEQYGRLVATGFHRNTLRNEEGGIDLEQFRVETIVDRVNTTGSVFLGLTIGCAQCHSHKFDPIEHREYYQLFAFLNNADEPTLELASPEQLKQRAAVRSRMAEIDKRRKSIDITTAEKEDKWEKSLDPEHRAKLPPEIAKIVGTAENGRTPRQKQILTTYYRNLDMVRHVAGGLGDPYQALAHTSAFVFRTTAEKQIADLKKQEPVITTSLVMQERKTPRVTNVHIQGDFTRKGAQVTPGVPAVLHPLKTANPNPNRLDLANWLVDPANPLTPRVAVNRFWLQYFGLGIVETENDFGTQGTPPSHPELLDWLASEFVAGTLRVPLPADGTRSVPATSGAKWSMKHMHRLIVTSAAYRQSSRARPDLAAIDPRNKLLARQSRLRIEAEVVRDVALAASGLLSPRIGGPSVYPPQPDGVYRFTQINKDWKPNTGPDRYRRGLYTYFWRSAPHPSLTVFDAPDSNSACTRRNRSNTPLQALTLLNDQAHFEFAQGLATRLLKDKASDSERVQHAFRLLLSRPPRDFELKRLTDLLAQQRASFEASPQDAKLIAPVDLPKDIDLAQFAAWTTVGRVLLNLDEFITRE